MRDEFYGSGAHVTARSLREMGDEAISQFHERHPELTDEAVEALAWCSTFDFR